MNPKKTKEKERRRARKLADEAWEAAAAENLDLAEKIIRRAVATQIDNPVLWNDQGAILALRHKDAEAEEAYRAAIALAPTYAEAHAHLAGLHARHGYLKDAIQAMEAAVRHAPEAVAFAERLEAYRALHATRSVGQVANLPEPTLARQVSNLPHAVPEPTLARQVSNLPHAVPEPTLARQVSNLPHAVPEPTLARQVSNLPHAVPEPTLARQVSNLPHAVPEPTLARQVSNLPHGPALDLSALAWHDVAEQLTCDGCATIESLVDPGVCAELRAAYDDDARFAKTVVMDRDDFGRGTYRYFRGPIPDVVDRLRRVLYPYAARIANQWNELLDEAERFPDDWEAFRETCARAGQTTPTPILLKYEAGGFNALHRDLRGRVFFPLQLAVVLSPRADGAEMPAGAFRGGEFLFCDVPDHKKARRREIAAGLGDAVLFCTRDRLVRIGGAYGLQPVKHGVNPIVEGTRFVLGVPFHEYR